MVVLRLMGKAINDQYVIIIHLLLIVSLVLYYKYSVVSSCISVFSAYLCSQLSNWIGLLVWMITGEEWCYYVSQIVIIVIIFFLLCRYACRTTEIIFARDKRELYIIGFLPTVYYLFDYFFAKFSGLLYSGNKVVVEFMGVVFCICYFIFLIVYFREYEKKQEMKRYSDLMEMQFLSIQKEIKQVKRSKEKLSILRHDMRHHLNIILIQLQNDNVENPIVKIPRFVDGVPTPGKKGHGIGVKSIVYYVEQLNGQCHFSTTDHSFVLRIII